MKNLMKPLALAAAILLSGLTGKAQQAGRTPIAPAPVNGPAAVPGPPPPAGPVALTQLTALSGKLTAYLANEQYAYDRFTLQTNNQTVTVRFPAQLGARLMKAAPKGRTVTVNGAYENGPEGNIFGFYSLKDGNELITDTPPAVNETPPVEKMTSFSGTISALNHDQRGMINGLLLDSKTMIVLPPPAVEQLAAYLKTGAKISGTGIQHGVPAGVVLAQNVERTDARTLSIGGQTYMLR